MYKRRLNLLTALTAAFNLGDKFKVSELNKELGNINRGKGRGGVSRNFHRPYNTYFPTSRRNGSKECTRRRNQTLPPNYTKGCQYPSNVITYHGKRI